ncbi:MAG: HEAT repeat domain-containing protein [Planctomycetota bacterium]
MFSACGIDGALAHAWDADTGDLLGSMDGYDQVIKDIAISSDATRVALVGSSNAILIWQIQQPQARQVSTYGCAIPPRAAAFLAETDRLVIAASGGNVICMTLRAHAERGALKGPRESIEDVTFADRGRIIVARSTDNSLTIWNARNCMLRHTISPKSGTLTAMAVDLNSDGIAYNCTSELDGTSTVCIVSARTGELQGCVRVNCDCVTCLALAPSNATVFAGCTKGDVHVIDVATSTEKRHDHPSHAPIVSIMLSDRCRRMVTICKDDVVCIWDTDKAERCAYFSLPFYRFTDAKLTKNEKSLVVWDEKDGGPDAIGVSWNLLDGEPTIMTDSLEEIDRLLHGGFGCGYWLSSGSTDVSIFQANDKKPIAVFPTHGRAIQLCRHPTQPRWVFVDQSLPDGYFYVVTLEGREPRRMRILNITEFLKGAKRLLKSKLVSARRVAVILIARVAPRPLAIGWLIQVLQREKDVDVRIQAVKTLGALRANSAVAHIQRALTAKSTMMRAAAAIALGSIQGRPSLPTLVDCLDDTSRDVRLASCRAILCLNDSETRVALERAANDRDEDVAAMAAFGVEALTARYPVDMLLVRVRDNGSEFQLEAIRMLGSVGGSRATDALLDVLESGSRMAHAAAVDALGSLGTPEARQVLRRITDHPDRDLAASAQRWLGYALPDP